MLRSDKPVIADIVVERAENVYPMIPGGAAYNEIKLSPADEGHTRRSRKRAWCSCDRFSTGLRGLRLKCAFMSC